MSAPSGSQKSSTGADAFIAGRLRHLSPPLTARLGRDSSDYRRPSIGLWPSVSGLCDDGGSAMDVRRVPLAQTLSVDSYGPPDCGPRLSHRPRTVPGIAR